MQDVIGKLQSFRDQLKSVVDEVRYWGDSLAIHVHPAYSKNCQAEEFGLQDSPKKVELHMMIP